MAKRNYWQRKFDSMNSIYTTTGDINYSQFGDISKDVVNDSINKAKQKGWGSVVIGGKEYTLYNKDGETNQIINPTPIEQFDSSKRYTAPQLAVYNWNNRGNKDVLNQTANYDVTNIPNIGEQVKADKLKIQVNKSPKIDFNNTKLNLGINNTNISSVFPTNSKKSKLENQYNKLFDDKSNYLDTDNEMIGQMNKYYGMGWGSPSDSNYNKNALGELRQTAKWITGNNNLLNDRLNKGQGYLAMESSRLNRNVGDYNFTYRDLLNEIYNSSDLSSFNQGKYLNNPEKFKQELFELAASYNGMQNHELSRLFGDNWSNILNNVRIKLINDNLPDYLKQYLSNFEGKKSYIDKSGRVVSNKPYYKNGGKIDMLFI